MMMDHRSCNLIYQSTGDLVLSDFIIDYSDTYDNSVKYGGASVFYGGTNFFYKSSSS